jgi:hypothetical protein
MRLGCIKNALLVLPIAWFGSGCAMYSETRDKQGKALVEAYSKVDLKRQFEVPRQNRAAILAQQLDTVNSLEAVRRDGLIRAVATGRSQSASVLAQLNMVSQLSGADAVLGAGVDGTTLESQLASRKARSATLDAWTKDEQTAATMRQIIVTTIEPMFSGERVAQPSCKDIQMQSKAKVALDKWIAERAGTNSGVVVGAALQFLTQKCVALQVVLDHQAATNIGGELGKVLETLAKEETDYRNLKLRTEAERTAVEAALAARDEADEQDDSKGVREAAEKIQKLLAIVKQAKDVFSIQFISDKEQDALDEFLTTVKDTKEGETPKAGSSKAAMAVVLFPDLMKAAQAKLDDAGRVSLAPLVLQKNISQIAYDSATRDIETRATRIQLLRQQADLLREQVRLYVEQDGVISAMNHDLLRMSMVDALAPLQKAADGRDKPSGKDKPFIPTIEDKMKVWTSLATYIDQGTRSGGEVSRIGFKLHALESEILLAYSEANVTQWDALISSNVSQVAAYGASGIKVEQITALINSATLLWIGAGVH